MLKAILHHCYRENPFQPTQKLQNFVIFKKNILQYHL